MGKKVLLCVGMSLLAVSGSAHAVLIDLNEFFADPTVTVSADGTHALFEESPSLSGVILSNDPSLGDLEVIVAGTGVFLEFDYIFTESALGDDEFGAWIIDPGSGFSLGAPFEFFSDASGSGTVSFDLSSLAGTTGLGFQFQLSSLPGDANFDSTLEINNLRLVTVVPEPSTLIMGGIGIGLLAARRRRRAEK